jgi:hypothetical protein
MKAGERTRKGRGKPPNSGHCSKTKGNTKLVYGEAIAAEAGLDGIQTKLVSALNVATDELCFISDGKGTLRSSRQKRANENKGALGEHVFQGDVFAGEVVPGKFGLFDKEIFILVPTRDFHAASAGNWKRFCDHQSSSGGRKSSFSASERKDKRKQGKQLEEISKNKCAAEKQNVLPMVQSEAERGGKPRWLKKRRCGRRHHARLGKPNGR